VYNSTASVYFAALKATFPFSLTFSARTAMSSSGSTGPGEDGSATSGVCGGRGELDPEDSAVLEQQIEIYQSFSR